MKTQIKKDLHTKTVSELKKLLDEAAKAVAGLKLDHAQNKLKNTRDIFNRGKEVAVLKTIMNMKKTVEGKVEKVAEEVKEKVEKSKGGKK